MPWSGVEWTLTSARCAGLASKPSGHPALQFGGNWRNDQIATFSVQSDLRCAGQTPTVMRASGQVLCTRGP